MPIDPFTAAAVVNTIGKIFGGHSKKRAAKRRYRLAVQNIKKSYGWKREDLTLGTQSLMGRIKAASYSQGRRGAPAVLGSEADKFTLRMNRITEQEQMAIKSAAMEKRNQVSAANWQMGTALVTAPIDYQMAKFQSNYYGWGKKNNTGTNNNTGTTGLNHNLAVDASHNFAWDASGIEL